MDIGISYSGAALAGILSFFFSLCFAISPILSLLFSRNINGRI